MALVPSSSNPVAGFYQDWGTKHVQVAEVVGPTSYVQGGQTINASQFGWGGFDWADVTALSYTGTYYGRIQYLPVQVAPSTLNPGLNSVKLLWYVLATNAEVAGAVSLAGEVLRIIAIGS